MQVVTQREVCAVSSPTLTVQSLKSAHFMQQLCLTGRLVTTKCVIAFVTRIKTSCVV